MKKKLLSPIARLKNYAFLRLSFMLCVVLFGLPMNDFAVNETITFTRDNTTWVLASVEKEVVNGGVTFGYVNVGVLTGTTFKFNKTTAGLPRLYNKTALPGKIISITTDGASNFQCYGGNSSLTDISGGGGIQVGDLANSWNSSDFNVDYRYFQIVQNAAQTAISFSSITIEYELPAPTVSPELTAAIRATVDAAFDVTFTDDPVWRSAITSIMFGASTLDASAYTISDGMIRFMPSASVLLQSSGNKNITIIAAGYTDAVVSQSIDAGIATQLVVQTQPRALSESGAALTVQPVVAIVDQYGNASSSLVTVTASVGGSASWLLGGTLTQETVNGVATFTDLTATNEFTGATITFIAGALTVSSNVFNIPAVAIESIIINPGFENTIGDEWTILGTTIVTDVANVHSGTKAVHMNANNNLYQFVNLTPNTEYELSCYAKVAKSGAITFLGITEQETQTVLTNLVINTTVYKKYLVSFTTNSTEQYKIWAWTANSGDYYFDDFVLLEKVKSALNNETSNRLINIINNPNENTLRIELLNNAVANIRIFNTLGKAVYTSTSSSSIAINKNDIGHRGMYIVEVRMNDKQVVEKVIL